jgi:hypothetical protein
MPVRDEVRQAGEQAIDATRSAVSEVRRRTEEELGRRKHEASQRLHNVASAIRDAGQRLEHEDAGGLGRYADTAARQIDRLSDYVRHKGPRELLHDTEEFARRNPDLFLGASFVAGVVLARFLKSSGERAPVGGPEPGRADLRSSGPVVAVPSGMAYGAPAPPIGG